MRLTNQLTEESIEYFRISILPLVMIPTADVNNGIHIQSDVFASYYHNYLNHLTQVIVQANDGYKKMIVDFVLLVKCQCGILNETHLVIFMTPTSTLVVLQN